MVSNKEGLKDILDSSDFGVINKIFKKQYDILINCNFSLVTGKTWNLG